MKAPPALAALTALAALLIGGCSTDYQGASKTGFLAAGNAVCDDNGASVKPALDALTSGARVPSTADVVSFAGDVAVPDLQQRVDKLRQLEAPVADRGTVDDIIRAYQKGIDEITADPMSLEDGDPLLDAFSRASSYGLTSCGR